MLVGRAIFFLMNSRNYLRKTFMTKITSLGLHLLSFGSWPRFPWSLLKRK